MGANQSQHQNLRYLTTGQSSLIDDTKTEVFYFQRGSGGEKDKLLQKANELIKKELFNDNTKKEFDQIMDDAVEIEYDEIFDDMNNNHNFQHSYMKWLIDKMNKINNVNDDILEEMEELIRYFPITEQNETKLWSYYKLMETRTKYHAFDVLDEQNLKKFNEMIKNVENTKSIKGHFYKSKLFIYNIIKEQHLKYACIFARKDTSGEMKLIGGGEITYEFILENSDEWENRNWYQKDVWTKMGDTRIWMTPKYGFERPYGVYPNELKNNPDYCKNKRFIVYQMGISLPRSKGTISSHANLVIVDEKMKTIERFEPNGTLAENMYPGEMVDEFMNKLAKEVLGGYKYIPPVSFCPSLGPQAIEQIGKESQIGGGFCMTWSTMYSYLRIKYPGKTAEDIIKFMLFKEPGVLYTPEEQVNKIKKFQNYIETWYRNYTSVNN